MKTPRDIAEQPEPAKLPRRLAALCYDSLLLAALLFVFMLVLFMARGALGQGPPGKLWLRIAAVVVAAVFYCGFWTHGGQTVGMRAWRIRLVSEDGGPVRWGAALVRFFAACLSALLFGLGYWWSLVDRRRRTWHDLLAGTSMVHERREASARE